MTTARRSKLTLTADESHWLYVALVICDENGIFEIFLPKTHNPNLAKRKTSDKSDFQQSISQGQHK